MMLYKILNDRGEDVTSLHEHAINPNGEIVSPDECYFYFREDLTISGNTRCQDEKGEEIFSKDRLIDRNGYEFNITLEDDKWMVGGDVLKKCSNLFTIKKSTLTALINLLGEEKGKIAYDAIND